MMRGRTGFSMIELMTAIVVMVIITGIALPRTRALLDRTDMRNGVGAVVTLFNQTRMAGISSNRSTAMRVTGNTVVALAYPRRSAGAAACGCDTIGRPRNLEQEFGVTLTAAPDSIRLDPRGLSVTPATAMQIVVGKGVAVDTVLITGYGQVVR